MSRKKPEDEGLMLDEPIVISVESEPEPSPPGPTFAEHEMTLWFEIGVRERHLRFVFVEDVVLTRANDGDEAFGLSVVEEGVIAFAVSLLGDIQALRKVFVHEWFHVGLHAPLAGSRLVTTLFGTKKDAIANDREEDIASYWSANVAEAFFTSGIMKLPKLPKIKKSRAKKTIPV